MTRTLPRARQLGSQRTDSPRDSTTFCDTLYPTMGGVQYELTPERDRNG